MDRRSFLAGTGLVAAGVLPGTGIGLVCEPALAAEGPTARTATPSGLRDARVATVRFRERPAGRLVALTIDDGPTAQWTPKVLDILAYYGVPATFFLVGQRAQAQPALTERAADAGHEFGNHTWAHTDLTGLNEPAARVALERTHELVSTLTGREPSLCRPPYGRIDSVGLLVCAAMRYDVMLWSDHVTGSNARADVTRVLRQATPGSIVLGHDGGPEPNATLMVQLDRLVGSMAEAGYTFVTVSDLLAAPARPPGAGSGADSGRPAAVGQVTAG
jgi:peptidoglycan/xylan/chitin deacetylase (PgdA/CDA1 family)